MIAFADDINAACLQAFAEPFTYRGLNGDVELLGVFSEVPQQADFGGQRFGDKTFTLELLKTSVDAAGVEIRQPVVVDGVEYQIINMQTDATGMSTLTLRRYK